MPDWFQANDQWFARLILQRGIGLVYLVAFWVALRQFPALLGERGLLPAPRFLEHTRFIETPSLFHLGYSDRRLAVCAGTGAALSLAIVLGLPDAWPVPLHLALWLTVWALYLSIVNVGQRFYSFGWESLLLEAGFLGAFLGPTWTAAPAPILWLFRWLLFRVEFGAGLIKLRGDPCWRKLTCLDYHHQTQPMPNPLSWYFHHLPRPLHRLEVLGSHFAQLLAPALLFLPQPIAGLSAAVMAVTQLWLVLSGNYAWLNWITLVLTASALDDAFLPFAPGATSPSFPHQLMVAAVAVLILALSYRPARNLISSRQLMNASFDSLHLVNTYGAFGSVTRERREVVLEGTADDPRSAEAEWREYEFRGKPTDPRRRPGQFAPYHLRLDWLMWFLALSPSFGRGWFPALLEKLTLNDAATLRLLRRNPFPDRPPAAIRAVLYKYRFSTWAERRETGAWWVRTRVGEYRSQL
jgi:hypothetical protein